MSYVTRPTTAGKARDIWDYAVRHRGKDPLTLSYNKGERGWWAFYSGGTSYGAGGGCSSDNDLFITDTHLLVERDEIINCPTPSKVKIRRRKMTMPTVGGVVGLKVRADDI